MKGRRIMFGVSTMMLILGVLALAPSGWGQSKHKTLYKFIDTFGGRFPTDGLVFDGSGNLYGTTRFANYSNPGGIFKIKPNANGSWTESLIYAFPADGKSGSLPYAGLIFDHAGNLYGTTSGGGTENSGTVFKLKANSDGSWTESVLFSFCAPYSCHDGSYPLAAVIFDQAGNLYGTTSQGGDTNSGTAFKLTPKADGTWTESVLHSFCSGKCTDGSYLQGGLILDQTGNLYGTAYGGGANGGGTVFKLTPNSRGGWTESLLYSFCPGYVCDSGAHPAASLIFDASGNLYGTTFSGGDETCYEGQNLGCGIVFKLTPNSHGGWTESVVYTFTGGDGAYPNASLIFDTVGNLYGTTTSGGDLRYCGSYGCGVVFKLTHDSNGQWKETVLHHFCDNPGASPYGSVIFDSLGNLYGTTYGALASYGSVFKLTP